MADNLDNLKSRCGSLTAKQRADLAYFLLNSLDDAAGDQDVDEAWRQEVRRRMAEIRSGKAVGIPAEEVFSKVRKRYQT